MEVPCLFRFVGNGGELKKLKSFFKTTPIGSDNNGNFIEGNYFTVKVSRLSKEPRKCESFSTMNNLQYTVFGRATDDVLCWTLLG